MREAFGAEFDVPTGYLNTSVTGVPPAHAATAVADAVSLWARGASENVMGQSISSARSAFAELVGVPADRVTVGATVSQLGGFVAASAPDGSRVLVVTNEFTSVSFPFAAQADRGVTVTEVELDDLVERAPDFDYVAVSVVQSADGRIVDLDGLRDVRDRCDTRVLLDVSQAAGWMSLRLDWADWVVGTCYKWLMVTKGAAWMAIHPQAPVICPHAAGHCAGDLPGETTYGLPLRLASDARAFDISPTWLSQINAAESMSWLAGLDMAKVAEHCVGLADEFLSGIGQPAEGSAIVSVDRPDAMAKLTEAGVRCSQRAGRARLAFHLYNTAEDVDLAVRALRRR